MGKIVIFKLMIIYQYFYEKSLIHADEFEEERNMLKSKIAELEHDKETLKINLNQQIEEKKKSEDFLQEKIRNLEEEIKNLEKRKRVSNEMLQKRIRILLKEKETLNTKISNIEKQNNSYYKEKLNLSNLNDYLKKQISSLKSDNETYSKKIRSLQMEMQRKINNIQEEKQSTINYYKRELNNKEETIEEVRSDNQCLNDLCDEKDEEISQLKDKLRKYIDIMRILDSSSSSSESSSDDDDDYLQMVHAAYQQLHRVRDRHR